MASKSRWKRPIFSVFSFLSCCVFVVLLDTLAYGKPIDLSPAWREEISRQASNYAEHVALPFVVKQLSDLQIPKVSGDVKTPLGSVIFDLHNITLSDVNITKANISLQSGHSVRMRTEQASFKISADWNYKEKSWNDYLSGDVSKKQGTVGVDNCRLTIGSIGIKFEGGASWLYNLFSNEIAQDLKKQLESQICKAAVKIIDSKANSVLSSLSGVVDSLKAME